MKWVCIIIIALLILPRVFAMSQDHVVYASCLELHVAAMTHAANGNLQEAEALIAAATVTGDQRGQSACLGLVMSNVAGITSVLGRVGDAERLAEESVRVLEKLYPPNDRVLLRPLQLIAAIRLESGRTAKARDAIKRIQAIRIERPEDSAIVRGTVGVLMQIEGRRSEAEIEYRDALRAWEEAGRSDSADAAAILHSLAALYIEEERLDDARRTLEDARAIYDRAKNTVPMDRAKFLDLRGVLHARLGEWQQSEADLREAVSIIDRQPSVDPGLLRLLLVNFSAVLRSNHRHREARLVERRTATLPRDRMNTAIVDISDLLVAKKPKK
jgi:tetratricopeptide (TPR) repeat protein